MSAPKGEAAPTGEAKMEMSAPETVAALMAPEGSAGRADNAEGVTHAQAGHWGVAEGHFRKALEADPKLAEAQFNLGLALSKQDKHDEATTAFKKAAEMAPDNTMITESPILKEHTSS
ncbi:MAG: tetratricopeptide repeat protein [Nitrospira sp.]|nr:tetratricopeptide repeat protein [Nitrospira sp.]